MANSFRLFWPGLAVWVFLTAQLPAQQDTSLSSPPPAGHERPDPSAKLRVFLDCSFCDFDFMRTEVTFVDYVRNRQDAEVHILERLPEDRRCHPVGNDRHQDEPFSGGEHELIADGLIDENLRLGWIQVRPDVRRVQEMDTHSAGRVVDRPVLGAVREIDARKRGEIPVPYRGERIGVLRERRLGGREIGGQRRC